MASREITRFETTGEIVATLGAILQSNLPIDLDVNEVDKRKVVFSTESPITENDRQALEKVVTGFAEWFGEKMP
ncbi:unnamed protein product [Sphagnum jensenii]|uniref:Uncharacterized protein n=1 Tax=Sphagnum jensenii TaxID=128206 RepID=A0ABP0V9Y1_9BRYO